MRPIAGFNDTMASSGYQYRTTDRSPLTPATDVPAANSSGNTAGNDGQVTENLINNKNMRPLPQASTPLDK